MVNILVGVDDSEYGVLAFQRALRFARPGIDTIFLLTVLDAKHHPEKRGLRRAFSSTDAVTTHHKSLPGFHALENKRHFMKFCSEKDINAVSLTEYGAPKDIITAAVASHSIDLVIVGSRGRGSAKKALLGSTCDYCLKTLNIPVLVVKKLDHMYEFGLPHAPYAHSSLPVAGPSFATVTRTTLPAQ
eukprot:TRINITY_DN766_c0_g1_i1.p1 TRINITY_DN766_c0_g1~~TRINITY_DN766_c0_g1_i1.p1  ORF type:complete len:203 (+),score=36.43 TRINITY_DN766_c0_g1_i1:49-609(+)